MLVLSIKFPPDSGKISSKTKKSRRILEKLFLSLPRPFPLTVEKSKERHIKTLSMYASLFLNLFFFLFLSSSGVKSIRERRRSEEREWGRESEEFSHFRLLFPVSDHFIQCVASFFQNLAKDKKDQLTITETQ